MTRSEMEKKIKRLSSRFRRGVPWYQCVDFECGASTEPRSRGKARQRTESFIPLISKYLKAEDKVLDLGCNAGLFTYLASEICQEAVGVEIHEGFYRQAEFVREALVSEGHELSKATIRLCNVIENLDLLKNVTVVFASKVLYHKNLGDGLYDLMKAIEISPARLILAQGHVTQGEIGQSDGMRNLFGRYGFEYELVTDDPDYPVAVGSRSGNS